MIKKSLQIVFFSLYAEDSNWQTMFLVPWYYLPQCEQQWIEYASPFPISAASCSDVLALGEEDSIWNRHL
jgi:hypothetical protein